MNLFRHIVVGLCLCLGGWSAIYAKTGLDKELSPGSLVFSFSPVAKMPGATAAHTGTGLADGNVLVVGGYGRMFGVPIAVTMGRVYEQETGKWRSTRGVLNYGRLEHCAIALPDGKVLIAGGQGQMKNELASVELYDPGADTFFEVGNMVGPRVYPQMNVLADGRVLITGDQKKADIVERSEGAAAGYSIRAAKGQMLFRHKRHVSIVLGDGTVCLIGGRSTMIERFDPQTETFTASKVRMPGLMDDQAGILLYDGRIFLAGGQDLISNRCVAMTWVYDPQADILTAGPDLNPSARGKAVPGVSDLQIVDLLARDPQRCGRYIFLCGGEYDPGRGEDKDINIDSAWVYDAERERLMEVGPMRKVHDDFAAVAIPAGADEAKVLIIGGHGPNDRLEADCEIFSWGWEQ